MRLSRSSIASVGLLAATCLTSSCGIPEDAEIETKSSELTTATSRIVVPAYFPTNSSSWTTIESGSSALPAGSIVIANPDNGPGSSFDSALYSHLSTLKSHGVIVIGYVSARLDLINNAENDVWAWNWFYGGQAGSYGPAVVDGIFFDDTQRNYEDDLKRLRFLGENVQSSYMTWASSPPYVMYNYGEAYLEHNYTDCLIQVAQNAGDASRALFVTQENAESYYVGSTNISNWADSSWNWVNQYKPSHFAHIAYDATTSSTTTQDAIQKARTWNAAYVYVTDGPFTGNTFGALASSAIWSDLLAGTNSSHTDFGGSASETYSTTCPAACSTGSACWCSHDMCTQGVILNSACSPCVSYICTYDSYCCDTAWDGYCVNEVTAWCDSTYACPS